MPENGFDLIIIGILLFFTYRGFRRGIIEEFGKLVAFFSGVVLAWKYYPSGAQWVRGWMEIQEDVSRIVGFVVVFILVVVSVRLFAFLLKKAVHIFMLGWLDKLVGVIFGFIKGAIILSVVFWVISVFPEIKIIKSIKEDSVAYRFVDNFKNNLIDTFDLHSSLDSLKQNIRDVTVDRKKTPSIEDIPLPLGND